MGDVSGPISDDKFQPGHIYQSDSFDVQGHNVRLRIAVLGNSENGFDVNYRYYDGPNAGELFSKHTDSADQAGRLFRTQLFTLPSGTGIYELYSTPEKSETKQGERNVTTKPAEEKSTADNVKEGAKGEPKNDQRPANDTPQTESPEEYTGGTLLEDVEHWIPSLTADAHSGVQSLKNDLNDYVLEGGNWFGAALAGTALDVADAAMSFTEGIPLGFLDTRNIGEGLAEGTWEGAKKDISRALNVLPQGKILRAVDRAMTASNVIESAGKGDLKAAAMTGVLAVAGSAGRKAVSNLAGGKAASKVKIDPEKTSAFKSLVNKEIIKERKMSSADLAWTRFQKRVTGNDKEYRIKLGDGRTIDVDGLGVHKNGKLILKEAKLGLKKHPEGSKHLEHYSDKKEQLKRYFQALRENPNEISHIELHYNRRATGEIYKNIVEQKLTLKEIASIHFVWHPFGHNPDQ
jgi:hypothetical protein